MAKSKISQLPQYTGDTTGVYLLMDNSGQTQTFKVLKEDITPNLDYLATTGSNTFVDDQLISSSKALKVDVIRDNSIPGNPNKIMMNDNGDITINAVQGDLNLDSSNGGLVIIQQPTHILGNTNIEGNEAITGSVFITSGLTVTGSITAASFVGNGSQLTNLPTKSGLVSGSSQISYTGITNVPSGIISGSSQLPVGLVSGSSQLTSSYDTRYVLSGSISAVPNGTVSGSSQITTLGYATTSSLTSISSSLDSRLDVVEAFSSSLTVAANTSTKILDSVPYTSATSWSGSYNGNGGTVKVEANFTIWSNTSGTSKTLYLYRDGIVVDSGSFYFNAANTHMTMPTLYYIGNNEIGTHVYSVGHNGSADGGDNCTIIVTEIFNALITGSVNYVQVLGNQRNGITSVGTAIVSGSITATGKPIQIMVSGDANPTSGTGQWCGLQLYRDSTAIGNPIQVEAANINENQSYCLNVIDNPSAGSHTYTMKVNSLAGTFQFGELSGPVMTIVELGSIAQMASLGYATTGSNSFVGNQTVTGSLLVSGSTTLKGTVNVGTGSGYEGGEIDLVYAQNTTLTGSFVAFDVYSDKVRIFEGGGSSRGVSIDLSKAPSGVGGDLMWKTSGLLNTGLFVQMDNIKAGPTRNGAGGSLVGLSIGAVSTTFVADISATYSNATIGGTTATAVTYTTTAANSAFGWGFSQGNQSTYILNDTTNNRVYRITFMAGASFNNNFTSIERLY